MKTFRYIIAVLAAAIGLSACVDDLNVKPIDPSMLQKTKLSQLQRTILHFLASAIQALRLQVHTDLTVQTTSQV